MQPEQTELGNTETVREDVGQLVADLNLATDAQPEVFEHALERVNPSEVALLLESLPLDERLARWQQIPADEQLDVLVYMRGQARLSILRRLSRPALEQVLDRLDAEDLVELEDTLPESWLELALGQMDRRQRKWYEQAQAYSDSQIGRYLNHEMLIIPANTRVSQALKAMQQSQAPYLGHAYVVDQQGIYLGAVSLQQLYQAEPTDPVSGLELAQIAAVEADTEVVMACESVEHSGYSALPVVDENLRLVGRVTLRMAIELNREDYENRLMAPVGLDEEADLFMPVLPSARRRAVWLGMNLLTALLAAWVIGLFEATIAEVVALAVLMPVVASMGGIAGSQTLTLMIRGLAMKQVAKGNVRVLFQKELGVALLNGVLWALVIGAVASLWFSDLEIGAVIALAILANILVAGITGVILPLVLEKLKIDPALSGSVILTTVTDVVGFFVFLGLGSLYLL